MVYSGEESVLFSIPKLVSLSLDAAIDISRES